MSDDTLVVTSEVYLWHLVSRSQGYTKHPYNAHYSPLQQKVI